MSKQTKNKCICLSLFLFTFLFILSPKIVFAESDTPINDPPEVQSYKMISDDNYIKWSTEHEKIGIIVEFDPSDSTIIKNTTSACIELNLTMEGGLHNVPAQGVKVDSITLNDEEIHTPKDNELLFLFEYFRGAFFLDETQQPGENNNEPYLLKVENIIINDISKSVETEPLKDGRVYFDEIPPEFIDGVNNIEITSTEESYQYQEKLTMDLHFDEPVKILDDDESIKFCIYPKDDDKEVIVHFNEVSGSGTKNISVSYTFDKELRADYPGDINVIIDETLVTDIAGNELTIPYNSEGYFDVFHDIDDDDIKDDVIIDSIYPVVTEEIPPIYDDGITIKINDDDKRDTIEHLTGAWDVQIFLSGNKIIDIDAIEFENYPLLFKEGSGNDCSYLTLKDKDKGEYKLYITTSDDAFNDANGEDRAWYLYYYIKDADGNKIYGEVENVYIDRAPPEINITEDYLTPLTNQAIQFEINDSKIDNFGYNIINLDNDVVCALNYYIGDLGENVTMGGFYAWYPVEHLKLSDVSSTSIAGIIDVEGMVEFANQHLGDPNNPETSTLISLNTNTYKLIIYANDNRHQDVISEENVLFTIDKTPPTVDIKTTVGDAETIDSYKLTFSDINGKEVITAENPDLMYDDDNEITLYYEFVEAGLSSYPEAQDNYKKVYTGNEVEIDVPYGDLTSGTYCLNIKGVDHAGNIITDVSIDTFNVPDPPIGTMSCDDFSNDLTLDVNYTVTSTYDNLEYRVYLDNNDSATWTENWQTLNHTNGTGTLSVNLDNSLDQGEHDVYIQYRFTLNNAYFESDIVSDSFIYDTEGPTANISYSTEELTYEPVNATLVNIEDNYTGLDDIIVSLEGIQGSEGTKVVKLNTSEDEFTFVLTDKAGNVSKYVAHAPLICSDAKPAKVVYSTKAKTTDNVTVHLEFESMNDDEANITLLDNIDPLIVDITSQGGIYYYTFKENGNYNFEYIDDINRTGYITAFIHNIDRIAPTADISYNITQLTNYNVYGYINPSETIDYEIYNGAITYETISGGSIDPIVTGQSIDGETIKYSFTENGLVTVLLEDEAENSNIYNLSVDYIDKTPPNIMIDYSDNYSIDPNEKTRDDVTITISAIETINILNNNQNPTRVFTENEEYTFMIEDKAGNHVNVDINIVNIDKSEPVVELNYSPEGLTKENVTVTLTSDVPITILNNGGSNELIFTENGRKYFQYKDEFDRKYLKFVDVTNIDKQPPVMKFDKYKDIFVEVGGEINLNEGVSIFDDVDGTITNYTIDDNVNLNKQGTYYANYTFTDTAGNEVIVERTIEVLSDLTLVINGIKATDDLLIIDGLDLDVNVYFAKGNYEVQFKEGLLRTGKFKKNKQLIRNSRATANKGGYVTFYVQDQERNWKLVRSYIYE